MPRARRGRSTRGRSSVFTPSQPRVSQRFAATASRPSKLGPDVSSALAPQVETMAPEGPIFDGLPPVDVDYSPSPEQTEEQAPLLNAIFSADPLAPEPQEPVSVSSGGTTGDPAMDQSQYIAEALSGYGAGSAPPPSDTTATQGGLYTGDMLLKKLMQLGY